MYKYKVKLNAHREGGELIVYEVMETVNIPQLIPGKTFNLHKEDTVTSYIMNRIDDEDVKRKDVEIVLRHPYAAKLIDVRNPIEIKNGPYSSFEIRHDHAGQFDNLYDISTSLDNVANAIEERGKND